jgi:hypothetical protein
MILLRVFTTIARGAGISVGVFLLVFATLDVMGLIPHSYEMPPLAARLARYVALVVFSTAFLLPYRRMNSPAKQMLIKAALGFTVLWTLYVSVSGLRGYVAGEKSWHVVPFSIVLCAIVAANIFAFARLVPRLRDV